MGQSECLPNPRPVANSSPSPSSCTTLSFAKTLTVLLMNTTAKTESSETNLPSLLALSFLSQDVPLISLANILHNAKLWNDAVIVATMAVEIAPHFAVNHFTLGNVYVAMVRLARAEQACSAAFSLGHIFDFKPSLTMSVSFQFPLSFVSKLASSPPEV
uniref:Uncharacterized protein n=1 Tax=Sus scrofa TaxID=9823 RepID=A0A8D1KIS0_PIG